MSARFSDHTPDSTDRRDIDALIAAFYEAFDNRCGRVPTLSGMRDLFCERAVISQRSDGIWTFTSPTEFARPRIELLVNGSLRDFHEWEEDASTRIAACMATRTSRYAKSGLLEGGDYAGNGSKIFQLIKVETGWRIVALSWVDDEPDAMPESSARLGTGT